jgi:integrase
MFTDWAVAVGFPVDLPVATGTIALYLTASAGDLTSATLSRRLSAIRYRHHREGHPSPTDHPQIKELMSGIRRVRQDSRCQARPFYLEDLAAAVADLGESAKDTRDRALMLVGWWGAFRRSELVGIGKSDIEAHPAGVIVNLRRSKTDQEGRGRQVPLHYHEIGVCPVRALRAWSALLPDGGPAVFRRVDRWGNVPSGRLAAGAVSQVVKMAAERIGLDPGGYSAHSLRAGFVSECDRRGILSSAVRLVTGHATDAMLSTYTRPRSLFKSSAGAFFDG